MEPLTSSWSPVAPVQEGVLGVHVEVSVLVKIHRGQDVVVHDPEPHLPVTHMSPALLDGFTQAGQTPSPKFVKNIPAAHVCSFHFISLSSL